MYLRKYLFLILPILLISCMAQLKILDNRKISFHRDGKIFISIQQDLLGLSNQIKSELYGLGFNLTDNKAEAEYILTVRYSFKNNNEYIVFNSFYLYITDTLSNETLYVITLIPSVSENFRLVIKRASQLLAKGLYSKSSNPKK